MRTLPDALEMAEGEEGEDSLDLIYPGENDLLEEPAGQFDETGEFAGDDSYPEEDGDAGSGEIVITIPGAERRRAGTSPPLRTTRGGRS